MKRPGSFWRSLSISASARKSSWLFLKKSHPAGPPPGRARRKHDDSSYQHRQALRRLRRPGRREPVRPRGKRLWPCGPQRRGEIHPHPLPHRHLPPGRGRARHRRPKRLGERGPEIPGRRHCRRLVLLPPGHHPGHVQILPGLLPQLLHGAV